MIRFRKLMTLVTVTALLLTLWVPAAVSATPAAQQEELLYFGRSIIAQMDNSEALYFAYDRLVEGFANQQTAIDVTHDTYRLTADEAWTAYDLVLADHPEFFYAEKASLSSSGGTVHRFSVTYSEELLSYATLVTHRAKVLTEGLENKSDYEISLILHDRICDAVKYNLNSQHNQTVVSSLALGETVCAGYSRAYQMMLQMLGIPCFYVVGTADNGAGIGAHGWNLVQLDGEWYYTDVTWDDQNDNGGAVYYAYLNNTYEQFARDHFADEYADYLPRSTATANNYFVKNGLVLTPGQSINVKKAAAAIKNSSSAQFYFAGSDMNEGINMVFDVIDDILRELVGNHYFVSGLGMLGHELLVFWECDLTHSFETATIPACGGSPGTITQHCTVCGYTKKQTISPVGHEMEWEWDETHHTYHCHHCDVVEVYGEHVYDNACDTDCNVCGAIRAVGDHVYDNACDADCNECGVIRAVGDHVYENAYDAYCNVCGALASNATTGTTGDCTWTLINGHLTISGNGKMGDYWGGAPWGESITSVTVEDGVTTIGVSAFYGCDSLTAVTIPDSVTAIGDGAFGGCASLTDVYYAGTEEQKAAISIGSYNQPLLNATWHYHWPQPHTYDNACDTDCNECGSIRTVGDHIYDNACDADCNECNAIRTVGDHVYDNACDADCNICGVLREPPHDYDDMYDDECNICGAWREVPERPEEPTSTPGDLNRDGIVNNRDLALMQQYINKWNVTIDTAAADVNTDGTINNRDLALLQQYINKWDVTLG